ncbi:TetR/AcrR family transcriptional regulator [Nonomuraea sp. NPDC050556]|uniref:TetR/AcrR family transcriptional regulator n=1 Tax=Nonomuraea sp. NPDC050556 TaxID=3364369 RepID=UPI003787FEF6
MTSKRTRLTPLARRGRILDAAMAVFAERGYQAATMTEIADAAGSAASVIYDHFPSKASLQITLLELQSEELLRTVLAAVDDAPDDLELRVRAGVSAFFAFVEQSPYAWRMLFRDPPSDPEVADCHDRIHQRTTDAIARFLMASRHLRPPDERAVQMYAQMLKMTQHGLAVWWYEHQDTPRGELVDRMMDFCWTGLERARPH